MSNITQRNFFKKFPDDQACLEYIFKVKFGLKYECPKCHHKGKWYLIKYKKSYLCEWCGLYIDPTVGTVFEGSSISLKLWFYAMHLFTSSFYCISVIELQKQLGVTYKTAWRMLQLIRRIL